MNRTIPLLCVMLIAISLALSGCIDPKVPEINDTESTQSGNGLAPTPTPTPEPTPTPTPANDTTDSNTTDNTTTTMSAADMYAAGLYGGGGGGSWHGNSGSDGDDGDASNPNLTSWSNNQTNDSNTTIIMTGNGSIHFNATSDQNIVDWHWCDNGTLIPNMTDNYTTQYVFNQTYNVSVNVTNVNGTSETITWAIIPVPEIATICMVACGIFGLVLIYRRRK